MNQKGGTKLLGFYSSKKCSVYHVTTNSIFDRAMMNCREMKS